MSRNENNVCLQTERMAPSAGMATKREFPPAVPDARPLPPLQPPPFRVQPRTASAVIERVLHPPPKPSKPRFPTDEEPTKPDHERVSSIAAQLAVSQGKVEHFAAITRQLDPLSEEQLAEVRAYLDVYLDVTRHQQQVMTTMIVGPRFRAALRELEKRT